MSVSCQRTSAASIGDMSVAMASRALQHAHTGKSAAAFVPVQPRLAQRTLPAPSSRRSLQVSCRSRKQSKKDDDKEFIRIKIGSLDLSVNEQTIWKVAVPAAGFLVLSALIGEFRGCQWLAASY